MMLPIMIGERSLYHIWGEVLGKSFCASLSGALVPAVVPTESSQKLLGPEEVRVGFLCSAELGRVMPPA